MSLGARVTSAEEKNSSRTQSPSVKRGRASMHAGEGTRTMRLCMNMQFIYDTVTVAYPLISMRNGDDTDSGNICRV